MGATELANAFFHIESQVNGLWTSKLLEAYNPNGVGIGNQNSIVCPEVYVPIQNTHNSYRADLVVRNILLSNNINALVSSSPLIVYERKVAGGDSWQGVREQIENWCTQSVLRNSSQDIAVGKPCWCIGTRGKYVRFWLYSARRAILDDSGMKPIKLYKDPAPHLDFDLAAAADDADTLEVEYNQQACQEVINFLLARHLHQVTMTNY